MLRARALEQALRKLINAAVQTASKIAEDGDRRWHVVDLVCATNDAEKVLAVVPPPSGASPQAEASEDEDDVPLADSWSAPLLKPVVPKILSTDDFYALLRILEVLPVADPFLTDLQSKLSDEELRQHGNRASHLSGPEFVREIERIEALIQSRLPAPVAPVAVRADHLLHRRAVQR